MALAKKRKIDDAGGSNHAGSRLKQARRWRIPKSHHQNSKRENLIMKMPAELRNEIYTLALGRDKFYVVEPAKCKTHWREPSLLLVSKQIRQEASPIYYLGNRSRILTTTDRNHVEAVRRWLKRIPHNDPFHESLAWSIYIGSKWPRHLDDWYSLTKLAYDTGLDFSKIIHNHYNRVNFALEGVLEVGAVARAKGWSCRSLKRNFEVWKKSMRFTVPRKLRS